MGSQATYRVFHRVHGAAQSVLMPVLKGFISMLGDLGCDPARGLSRRRGLLDFKIALRPVLLDLKRTGASSKMRLTGEAQPNLAAIRELLQAFGIEPGIAMQMARSIVMLSDAEIGSVDAVASKRWQFFNGELRTIYNSACQMHERLIEVRNLVSAPLEGTPRDSEDSVDQVCEILRSFPEMVGTIYAKAGLAGVEQFPPIAVGPQNSEAVREFLEGGQAWADDEAFWR